MSALLEFPERIKKLQRRQHYRVGVPKGFKLSVRVWVIADRAYIKDVPPRNQEMTCEVVDVSVGGLGVRLTGKKEIEAGADDGGSAAAANHQRG